MLLTKDSDSLSFCLMRLSALYKDLNSEQRAALAKAAGTSPEYLYQLATRAERLDPRRPRLPLMARLAAADERLTLADLVEEFNEEPKAREKAA